MDVYDRPDTLIQNRPDVPVSCFRPHAVKTAAKWFTSHFPGDVLYAVKANPASYVLSSLYEAGVRSFDVASVSEAQLVHSLFPDAFMAFMHPVKSRLAIEQAYFDFGVRDFAFDSAEELAKIVSATGNSKDLSLILRTAVPSGDAKQPLTGKFGALPDKAPELLKAARKVSRRLGMSFHVGSQTMNPQAYVGALGVIRDIINAVPRTKVDLIDVGGGFPSIYPDLTPPPLGDYAAAILQGIEQLPHPERYAFWCEPGRALCAESTSLLVKVELRKGDVLYINDGTYGSLFDAGPSFGYRYPVRLIRPTPGGSPVSVQAKPAAKQGKKVVGETGFRFYGPTCDSIDYMPGPFFLPSDVKEGDYIEIGQLGAYGNAMRTNFNGFYNHETVIVETPPLVTMYDEPMTTTDSKVLCAA